MKKMKKSKEVSQTLWPQYDLRFDIEEMKEKRRIDKHALDDMVEQQPELFGEVADAAAIAKSGVDSLSEQLKEYEADLDKQIRKDASEERITENEIKAKIAGDKGRKKLVIQLLGSQNIQRRLEALTTTFRHRSYAIRDCVDLYLASYYSSRSASGAREDKRDDEVDRINTRMGERRGKRVKRHRTRT